MFTERWDEIKEKLLTALELQPAQRSAYLAQIGAVDPELRKELDSLIASHERTGTDFLNMPVAELSSAVATRGEPRSVLGQRIGPYKIVEQIGVGGMGEVYRAFRADDEYLKQVAIKLVRAGQNSDFVIHRFKDERQILASLDHPNIARLLDGGRTEEGVPYFVMELIQGQPIDDYCDQHKLPITDRLKLFLQVCSAVQYAHQRLIIHRDIKPGNILVTAEAVPKLLDFGVAKILDQHAGQELHEPTLAVFRVLTPGYASPEQIKSEPIAISSDVYSLGVVLYELLTGHSPYRVTSRTAHELSRAACEDEPEKPSSAVRRTQFEGNPSPATTPGEIALARQSSLEKLSKRLSGDLDNIILMALRREPQRRYASVEQFALDIHRHLDSLPVLARKDTLGYRTAKFGNRHKVGVIAASVIALALLTALAVTIRANRIAHQQAEIARTERERAERRFNDVRKLANSMIFDLPGPIHLVRGSVAVEKMLYDNGLKYLDSLAAEAEGDVSLQRELAAGYKRLGDSQDLPFGGGLGDAAGALVSYRKSLQLRQRLVASDPRNISDQIDLSVAYRTIGFLLYKTGDVEGAREGLHKALEIIRPIALAHDDNVNASGELGYVLLALGLVEGEWLPDGSREQSAPFVGLPSVALRYSLDALNVFRKLEEKKQPDVRFTTGGELSILQLRVALVDGSVSAAYLHSANPNEAMRYAGEQLQALTRVDNADATTGALLTDERAAAHSHMGDALLFGGRWREAVSEYRSELYLFKQLVEPQKSESLKTLANGYVQLGQAESLAGNPTAGLKLIRTGIDTLRSRVPFDPKDRDRAVLLGRAFVFEGQALENLGDERGALQSYKQAADVFESPILAVEHVFDSLVAASYGKTAGALARLGYRDQARRTYDNALAKLGPQPGSEPVAPHTQYALIEIYAGLGQLESQSARQGAARVNVESNACKWYRKSSDIWLQMPVRNSISPSGFKVTDFDTVASHLAKCNH
jgi:non-specific serine/threonine protein kinase/serine/threonine-protein kinase